MKYGAVLFVDTLWKAVQVAVPVGIILWVCRVPSEIGWAILLIIVLYAVFNDGTLKHIMWTVDDSLGRIEWRLEEVERRLGIDVDEERQGLKK